MNLATDQDNEVTALALRRDSRFEPERAAQSMTVHANGPGCAVVINHRDSDGRLMNIVLDAADVPAVRDALAKAASVAAAGWKETVRSLNASAAFMATWSTTPLFETPPCRVEKFHSTDAQGNQDGPLYHVFVHRTRTCQTCCHDGSRNAEWTADGGLKDFGRCTNGNAKADDADASLHWCSNHQTGDEFEAWIHRPERPVFALVKASE